MDFVYIDCKNFSGNYLYNGTKTIGDTYEIVAYHTVKFCPSIRPEKTYTDLDIAILHGKVSCPNTEPQEGDILFTSGYVGNKYNPVTVRLEYIDVPHPRNLQSVKGTVYQGMSGGPVYTQDLEIVGIILETDVNGPNSYYRPLTQFCQNKTPAK